MQICNKCEGFGEIRSSSVEEIDRVSTKFAERLLQWLRLTDRQPNIISEGFNLNKDSPPHDKEHCCACLAGECDEIN